MLEIGLGCSMNYGPGASALLWRKLLPNTELWEADIDARCIKKHQISMLQQGIHTLVGNQRDPADLQRWIETSRSEFDAIIDDGSHLNADIMSTFDALWPQLQTLPSTVPSLDHVRRLRAKLIAAGKPQARLPDVPHAGRAPVPRR